MDIKKVLKDAEAAITTYEWLAVTEFDATTVIDSEDARKVLYEALTAQLDAVIKEMEQKQKEVAKTRDCYSKGSYSYEFYDGALMQVSTTILEIKAIHDSVGGDVDTNE